MPRTPPTRSTLPTLRPSAAVLNGYASVDAGAVVAQAAALAILHDREARNVRDASHANDQHQIILIRCCYPGGRREASEAQAAAITVLAASAEE